MSFLMVLTTYTALAQQVSPDLSISGTLRYRSIEGVKNADVFCVPALHFILEQSNGGYYLLAFDDASVEKQMMAQQGRFITLKGNLETTVRQLPQTPTSQPVETVLVPDANGNLVPQATNQITCTVFRVKTKTSTSTTAQMSVIDGMNYNVYQGRLTLNSCQSCTYAQCSGGSPTSYYDFIADNGKTYLIALTDGDYEQWLASTINKYGYYYPRVTIEGEPLGTHCDLNKESIWPKRITFGAGQ
ncbi:MAG: hypothetical protein ACPGXL_01455 [Chitinophagales bacterium]